MRILVESGVLLICAIGVISILGYVYHTKLRKPSAPDTCKHVRWSKWKTEQVQTVHLYSELDEGKRLPDRVDVYMTRECLRCGTPQAKTVRGIDSPHFK